MRPRRDPGRLTKLLVNPDRTLHQVGSVAHHALSAIDHAALIVAVLALTLAMVLLFLRARQQRHVGEAGRTISIGVPPEVKAGGEHLLWGALHDLLRPRLARLLTGQPHISWEIAATQAGTTFSVWTPRVIPPGLIERAITAAWPGSSATLEDPPSQPPHPAASGNVQATSELVLSGPGWFSLNTADPDPLPLILGQLSGLAEDEHARVQIIARPASSREQRRLRAAARRIRRGQPTHPILRLLRLLQPQASAAPKLDPTIAPDVRETISKSSGSLYRCIIRVTVSARTRGAARGRLHAVLGAFSPYDGTRVFLRRRRVPRADHKVRARRLGRGGFLLSVDELSALAHLPTQNTIPGLVMAGAREVAPPPGLPAHGKPLGHDSYGRLVKLAVEDARRHIHILGPTGVGKSTLLGNLALADFAEGRGVVVIDPKGDLIEDLLGRIPDGREREVDLLDPLDPAPPGLNVLDSPDPDLGTDQLVGIFHKIFDRYWGPRTDDILRAALLTLSQAKADATLADVPRLLIDRDWAAALATKVDDPVLEPFWQWYCSLSDQLRAQVNGPLLNKLRAFLLRRPVRAIVGQPHTTLDIPRALNEGRLLLCKLAKGTLGEDTSRLLGSFVVARVWQATLARAAMELDRRRDASCLIDEVHNYLNLPTPIDDVLAEARSYRLSLCLAHQHLAQLPRDLRESVSANARTKVYFQASLDDAHALEREVRPELSAHDLAHLPVYTAAVRLCANGQPGRAFTLVTDPMPPEISGRAQMVRTAAREQSGVAREQFEARFAADQRRPAIVPEIRRDRQPRAAPAAADPPTDRGSDTSTDRRSA